MSIRTRAALSLVAVAALTGASVPLAGATAASAASPTAAAATLAQMSLPQRVGQLFMVGTPAAGSSSLTASEITRYHVGNVMFTGRSYAGTAATGRLSRSLQALVSATSTGSVPLFVATDQEGGLVQVLHGPGFSAMPSGLRDGTLPVAALRADAKVWGTQLRSAGVDVDLGPVVDTVPSPSFARRNAPIGAFQREFGFAPATVAAHGTAFSQGLAAAGVAASVKHFPGLGRVTANTDVSSGVTDWTTTRHDAYLTPFAAAINAGAPFVMMSTAYYHRLDATHPAAFSPTIINTILRGDLGFQGVVISDDLANARQVARWTPGARAVNFIAAGGDMVLTVNPALLPQMYTAVLYTAEHNTAFRDQVDASALRVLTAKSNIVGLVRSQTYAAGAAVLTQPAPASRAGRYARYAAYTLRQGSRGGVVSVLQRALGLRADGAFGPATRSRVIAFERARHLPANGVVTRAVWLAL